MSKQKEKQEITRKVETLQNRYINEQDDKISEEAVEIVNMVIRVIETLNSRETDKALTTIENAIGKLEVLIAKEPSKELITIDVKRQIIDFPGTVEDVLYSKEIIAEFIKENELQRARDIMLKLASEMDIYVTVLPVASYPIALKSIVPLIEKERFEEAKELIEKAINTLMIEKIVIPLPVLRAEQSIIRASELTKNRENENRDELKELLAYAKWQLELAQALGYGKVDEDYKQLLSEIRNIENILKGENSTKDIFETLKEKLSNFMGGFNKISKPTKMPKAKDSE